MYLSVYICVHNHIYMQRPRGFNGPAARMRPQPYRSRPYQRPGINNEYIFQAYSWLKRMARQA